MRFALPTEPVPLAALAAGVVLGALALRGGPTRVSQRAFVRVAALASFALSAGYVALYLRGGPRIIDATSYWLEARVLAEGHLAWPVPEPATEAAGRFLVRDSLGDGDRLAVIFPPGYPAVLALGFRLGIPLWIGPALAAALTLATASLARAVVPAWHAAHEPVVRGATLLVTLCGALRYHTADTMSHGLSALCLTLALAAAVRLGRRAACDLDGLAAGAALGLLFATRPVSGLCGALLVAYVARPGLTPKRGLIALAAAAPFLALFAAHQAQATGAPLHASQSLYYAVSDGPAGCFRWGFGQDVGCLHEHGDFVRANLADGYGLGAALRTTFRRLWMHAVDPLNGEVLYLALGVPSWLVALRRPYLRGLALALPLFALAYAPFYFDGNYPGGGARFLADQLPVELVLAAVFAGERLPLPTRVARPWLLAAATLVSFALQGHTEHVLLRDREGGRPMFEPDVLARAGVARGLVFFDTDHGFDLAYDPDARVEHGVVAVRYRGDVSDLLAWDARGRPPAFRYKYDLQTGAARVTPFEPAPSDTLEAESLWPPLAQRGAWMLPVSERAASGGRCLRVVWDRDATRATLTLALPRRVAEAEPRIVLLGPSARPPLQTVPPAGASEVHCDERACRIELSFERAPEVPGEDSSPCFDAVRSGAGSQSAKERLSPAPNSPE